MKLEVEWDETVFAVSAIHPPRLSDRVCHPTPYFTVWVRNLDDAPTYISAYGNGPTAQAALDAAAASLADRIANPPQPRYTRPIEPRDLAIELDLSGLLD